MSLQEKTLQCFDCHAAFTFSVGEQEEFATRGHHNPPKRCPSCRQERKARQNVSNANSGSSYRNEGYGDRVQRQMFPAVCAECGKDTQVPFQPREDRPVYCSNCYNAVRLNRSR